MVIRKSKDKRMCHLLDVNKKFEELDMGIKQLNDMVDIYDKTIKN